MEKLGQLSEQAQHEGQWDLIVVDTPPSRSALDFLDAPNRLGTFLDGRFVRVLAAPARGAGRGLGRFLGAGLGIVGNIMQRIVGTQLLLEISMFVQALDSIFGGFRERAERTYALLQQEGTQFLVVAAPERDALREAAYFVDRLQADAMPLAGLVLNRVTVPRVPELRLEHAIAGSERLLEGQPEPSDIATASVLRLHGDRVRISQRQQHLAERFTSAHPAVPMARIPALADDVHDLAGLREIAGLLAGQESSEPAAD